MTDWVMVALTSVMALLTTVYVCTTRRILNASRLAQQQNVKMQLFEKRYEIYLLLKKWCDKTRTIFNSQSTNTEAGKTPKQLFTKEIFDMETLDVTDEYGLTHKHGASSYLNYMSLKIDHAWEDERNEVSEEGKKKYKDKGQRYSKNMDKIFDALKKLTSVRDNIDSARFLFASIPFDQVNGFTAMLYVTASTLSEASFEELKKAYENLMEAEILKKMENELKI